MLFYDFEVFKYDWLVVILDMDNLKEHVIVNDMEELEKFYQNHKYNIWVGFNNKHYDQYIMKGILAGFDPKEVNDFIIKKNRPGWQFSSLFRQFPMINYDVMNNLDGGLKKFEGFMGNDIRESSVPFDIDRPLTRRELEETVKYCRHDVEQTVEIFLYRQSDFDAQFELVKMYKFPLSSMSKTKVQLSANILMADKRTYNDEFDISFPECLKLEKYGAVLDWYKDPKNMKYLVNPNNPKSKKHQLEIMVAGVPHVFGWGGVHGAREKYHGKGFYLNMDVASLYPSLMVKFGLMSRSVPPEGFQRFVEIMEKRLELKAQGKKKEQAPFKIVINGTYGAMKDKNNPLYDPRQANNVCVYGQLLLLDLIEKLEPHCEIIQSNTDGVLIKMEHYEDYDLIDDICYEWEQRTGLVLEFDEFSEVFQKDVNNYVIIDHCGKYKSKGAYVKELNHLDYDLPIVNKALIDYMVKGIPVESTIMMCDDMKEFQMVKKISSKYTALIHGATFETYTDRTQVKPRRLVRWTGEGKILNEKCVRVFASKLKKDGGLHKQHATTKRLAKVENTPERCFMVNDEVNGMKVDPRLDKRWYIELAKKRLGDFGL